MIMLISSLLIMSCGDTTTSQNQNQTQEQWLIPSDEVFDGGPGKDGIPSIDNGIFIPASTVNYLDDDDLVVIVSEAGNAKVYPHIILDWHEIVNDAFIDKKYSLTYCPLTGTAISWNRVLNGNETTFGVSGKLYNTNLIPYDRETDSYWAQIGLKCVNGELINKKIETFPIIETIWASCQRMYPEAQVLSTETGFF